MKKIFTLLFILISTISAAQTYEIGTVCKESTQGWVRRAGACDNNGFLQGSGVASKGDVVVFGNFIKGLPNGTHHLTFVATPKVTFENQRSVDYFIESKNRAISKITGAYYDRPNDICKINFMDGQPADNIINCNGVVATAKAGNVGMSFTNGNAIFSMSEANISGAHPKVNSSELQILNLNNANMKFEGTAASIELGRVRIFGTAMANDSSYGMGYGLRINDLNGTATMNNDGEVKRKSENYIKGKFNLIIAKHNAEILLNKFNTLSYSKASPVLPVSESMKYDFAIHGNKFKAVLHKESGQGSLYASYLKIDNGVEFDGSGFELCENTVLHAQTSGIVKILFKEGSGNARETYSLQLTPRCGKITDSTGRSYSGFFDETGKPAPR
jgi:hypothetical protein